MTISTFIFRRLPLRAHGSPLRAHGLILKLHSVDDRSAAESLRGCVLTVPSTAVPTPAAGTYYHYQIIGMAVETDTGEALGTVREILPAGGTDVYVVRGEDGLHLVPKMSSLGEIYVDIR